MSVTVEAPHTQNTDAMNFILQGSSVPHWLADFFKTAFPTATVKKSEEISSSDWFRKMEAKDSPAKALKIMRTAAGYTQQALAEKLKMSKQNICAMEHGKRPTSLSMAHKLAKAIGTSYNMFYF